MSKISSGFSLHFLKTKIQVGILIPYKISAGKAIIETYKILILYNYNNRTQILKNRVVKETPSQSKPSIIPHQTRYIKMVMYDNPT